MIKSFRCKHTERLFHDEFVKKFAGIERGARKKRLMLHAAESLDDLRVPPGNRLEALRGDRLGQYSIRMNDQWHICFRRENGHALDVEIVDYHP